MLSKVNKVCSTFLASPVIGALVIGGAVVGGLALHQAHSSPAPAAAPVSVAVVDIAKLINGLKELETRNMANKAKLDELTGKLKVTADEIEKITTDLKEVIPQKDYARRTEAIGRLNELKAVHETRFKVYQHQLDVAKGDTITMLYTKSLAAIEALAKREGIDVVMIDDRSVKLPEIGEAVQREVFGVMDNKRMLYVKDGLDITDRLITIMNEQWQAGGGANAPMNPVPNTTPAPATRNP